MSSGIFVPELWGREIQRRYNKSILATAFWGTWAMFVPVDEYRVSEPQVGMGFQACMFY